MKIFWSVLGAGLIIMLLFLWINEQNDKSKRSSAFERQLYNEFRSYE